LFVIIFTNNKVQAQFIHPTTKKIDIVKIKATDPEGKEVILSVYSGNTGKYFSISPCGGIIRVDTSAYSAFIYKKTWRIKFKGIDEDGNFSFMTYVIVLKKDRTGNKFFPTYTFIKTP
jgi:hypothetical protein